MRMNCWRLQGWMGGAAMLAAVGLLAACAVSRQHAEGLQAMAAGDRERGLAALEAASNAEPTNSQYRMDYLKQLSFTVNSQLAQADEARRSRQYEAARQLYLKDRKSTRLNSS